MADMTSKEYQCDFEDQVPDHLYCQKCKLVARKFTSASCCGERYCPSCGEKEFNTLEMLKYQRQTESLKVHCNMEGRGCGWRGTLRELNIHLDPDENHCQYLDVDCHLNCQQKVPRNEMEYHLTQLCHNRRYTCQHCNFEATYDEVVNKHLPECKYVPIPCPNHCGVTEKPFTSK